MTSLSLPSWNSKPCCSPLAHSYHLHGNLTSSCFPIGFIEQDTQKGFPFPRYHPPPKMMLSTGTWAKFSYLGFRVLWLRNREMCSFLPSILLSIPPQSGCFSSSSLASNPKASGNICWVLKQLDYPPPRSATQEILTPASPPSKKEKKKTKIKGCTSQKTFPVLSINLRLLPSIPSWRLGTPCLKAQQTLTLKRPDFLAICLLLFFPPEE